MILDEMTRKEIILRSKSQSPDRVLRSKEYSAKDFKNVNFKQLFEDDIFTWVARVGKHTVAISFYGPFEDLKEYVKSMRGPNRLKRISVRLVAAALSKSLDENDIYVTCSCKDFKFRMKYHATKAGINFGKPQLVKPKYKKTNKDNTKGLVCKHILAVLQGKRWVPSAAKAWLSYMQSNPELSEAYLWDMDIKREKQAERQKDIKNNNSEERVDD